MTARVELLIYQRVITNNKDILQGGAPQWCERWFISHELISIN